MLGVLADIAMAMLARLFITCALILLRNEVDSVRLNQLKPALASAWYLNTNIFAPKIACFERCVPNLKCFFDCGWFTRNGTMVGYLPKYWKYHFDHLYTIMQDGSQYGFAGSSYALDSNHLPNNPQKLKYFTQGFSDGSYTSKGLGLAYSQTLNPEEVKAYIEQMTLKMPTRPLSRPSIDSFGSLVSQFDFETESGNPPVGSVHSQDNPFLIKKFIESISLPRAGFTGFKNPLKMPNSEGIHSVRDSLNGMKGKKIPSKFGIAAVKPLPLTENLTAKGTKASLFVDKIPQHNLPSVKAVTKESWRAGKFPKYVNNKNPKIIRPELQNGRYNSTFTPHAPNKVMQQIESVTFRMPKKWQIPKNQVAPKKTQRKINNNPSKTSNDLRSSAKKGIKSLYPGLLKNPNRYWLPLTVDSARKGWTKKTKRKKSTKKNSASSKKQSSWSSNQPALINNKPAWSHPPLYNQNSVRLPNYYGQPLLTSHSSQQSKTKNEEEVNEETIEENLFGNLGVNPYWRPYIPSPMLPKATKRSQKPPTNINKKKPESKHQHLYEAHFGNLLKNPVPSLQKKPENIAGVIKKILRFRPSKTHKRQPPPQFPSDHSPVNLDIPSLHKKPKNIQSLIKKILRSPASNINKWQRPSTSSSANLDVPSSHKMTENIPRLIKKILLRSQRSKTNKDRPETELKPGHVSQPQDPFKSKTNIKPKIVRPKSSILQPGMKLRPVKKPNRFLLKQLLADEKVRQQGVLKKSGGPIVKQNLKNGYASQGEYLSPINKKPTIENLQNPYEVNSQEHPKKLIPTIIDLPNPYKLNSHEHHKKPTIIDLPNPYKLNSLDHHKKPIIANLPNPYMLNSQEHHKKPTIINLTNPYKLNSLDHHKKPIIAYLPNPYKLNSQEHHKKPTIIDLPNPYKLNSQEHPKKPTIIDLTNPYKLNSLNHHKKPIIANLPNPYKLNSQEHHKKPIIANLPNPYKLNSQEHHKKPTIINLTNPYKLNSQEHHKKPTIIDLPNPYKLSPQENSNKPTTINLPNPHKLNPHEQSKKPTTLNLQNLYDQNQKEHPHKPRVVNFRTPYKLNPQKYSKTPTIINLPNPYKLYPKVHPVSFLNLQGSQNNYNPNALALQANSRPNQPIALDSTDYALDQIIFGKTAPQKFLQLTGTTLLPQPFEYIFANLPSKKQTKIVKAVRKTVIKAKADGKSAKTVQKQASAAFKSKIASAVGMSKSAAAKLAKFPTANKLKTTTTYAHEIPNVSSSIVPPNENWHDSENGGLSSWQMSNSGLITDHSSIKNHLNGKLSSQVSSGSGSIMDVLVSKNLVRKILGKENGELGAHKKTHLLDVIVRDRDLQNALYKG